LQRVFLTSTLLLAALLFAFVGHATVIDRVNGLNCNTVLDIPRGQGSDRPTLGNCISAPIVVQPMTIGGNGDSSQSEINNSPLAVPALVASVTEPASALLFGIGLLFGLGFAWPRRGNLAHLKAGVRRLANHSLNGWAR